MDADVDAALTRLQDALCSWERHTGRETTLVLVPHNGDENIVMSQSGKPLPPDSDIAPVDLVQAAMMERHQALDV